MKTYTGKIVKGSDSWLVEDGGDPPKTGEIVMVNGRTARVVSDRNDLVFDSQFPTDKFLVRFDDQAPT